MALFAKDEWDEWDEPATPRRRAELLFRRVKNEIRMAEARQKQRLEDYGEKRQKAQEDMQAHDGPAERFIFKFYDKMTDDVRKWRFSENDAATLRSKAEVAMLAEDMAFKQEVLATILHLSELWGAHNALYAEGVASMRRFCELSDKELTTLKWSTHTEKDMAILKALEILEGAFCNEN